QHRSAQAPRVRTLQDRGELGFAYSLIQASPRTAAGELPIFNWLRCYLPLVSGMASHNTLERGFAAFLHGIFIFYNNPRMSDPP
ncbi:hypothetical protein, partial [Caballeronia calidae]|uniref:hypothetical protein n=1 Tax=Caballeronia calidae TaxID=1777139 RepID=UPI001E59AA3A